MTIAVFLKFLKFLNSKEFLHYKLILLQCRIFSRSISFKNVALLAL